MTTYYDTPLYTISITTNLPYIAMHRAITQYIAPQHVVLYCDMTCGMHTSQPIALITHYISCIIDIDDIHNLNTCNCGVHNNSTTYGILQCTHQHCNGLHPVTHTHVLHSTLYHNHIHYTTTLCVATSHPMSQHMVTHNTQHGCPNTNKLQPNQSSMPANRVSRFRVTAQYFGTYYTTTPYVTPATLVGTS